jgi:hypothetical protein
MEPGTATTASSVQPMLLGAASVLYVRNQVETLFIQQLRVGFLKVVGAVQYT